MIDYNIIATGSKGNAVVIDQKILIDCGVSFKALSKVYRALKLVLLTHIHSDNAPAFGRKPPHAPFCVLCMAVQAAGGCRGAGLAD